MSDQHEIKVVRTEKALIPTGHYSQALVHNGTVYVAGQLGIDALSSSREPGTVEDQTRLALRNLKEVLLAANSDMSRILKLTIYLSDIKHWKTVNGILPEALGEHKPARSLLAIAGINGGFDVVIEAIAAVKAA